MTDLKELPAVYIVIENWKDVHLFEKEMFELYFDVKGNQAIVNKKKHKCADNNCHCHRYLSFVENAFLDNAKGIWYSGPCDYQLLGIYHLSGGWKFDEVSDDYLETRAKWYAGLNKE